ncbi:hypothetical protein CMI39_03210 [Candidatus Pacearchaeota archaeon]|nr:hypothetical protein [Candidatus Pacearchaeota archaeon]|tara:strand:+ start:1968 stop:2765 length:798 start_codon:yes stop_codon:yes gene_type:complete
MIELTPELAEICGIHAGDGYLRKRKTGKIELDITGNVEEKEYYDKHVIPLINKFFNLNLKGKFYTKGTYGFVSTNTQFHILNKLDFPFGKKSLIVRVPKLILRSKDKLIYSMFLRGLLDTDGHIGFQNRRTLKNYSFFKRNYNYYPLICIGTVSQKLSEGVCFMLNELEIGHFVYNFQPKKTKYRNNSYRYMIIISGVERLLKWMNLIGSKNSVKFSRYLVWKKHGHCPTNLTLQQRENILKGKLDINTIGSYVNGSTIRFRPEK